MTPPQNENSHAITECFHLLRMYFKLHITIRCYYISQLTRHLIELFAYCQQRGQQPVYGEDTGTQHK